MESHGLSCVRRRHCGAGGLFVGLRKYNSILPVKSDAYPDEEDS